ncbi:uncharacterized protein DNG_08128 [Cephalotrichum gorgonifer]|uniref:Major facilitator superfamily (MFS) profile domain-containing protein n=1 Tax=Cephalotrichum gorgonifer TaxID=2041049 RepID=A0AAE8N2X1_9PEZI|nr:uncharacterized protein DNG_08128 [Cephalotrichum gorgonifer]
MAVDSEIITVDESAPLLPQPQEDDGVGPRRLKGRTVTTILITCVFFAAFGAALSDLPILRITEDAICRAHLKSVADKIDESLCKDSDVQAELSFIVAMISMFQVIPGLVLGFPYGLLADRLGRRPVICLAVLGITLSIAWTMLVLNHIDYFGDIRLIWTAQIWLVIGGGNNVLVAVAYSIIADVEPAEKLSDAFFMLIVSALVGNLLATFTSSWLMQIDPWIPCFLSLGILTFSGLLLLFFPETLRSKPAADVSDVEQESPASASFAASIRSRLSHLLADIRQSTALIHSYPVMALLLTFLTTGSHARSLQFAPQYLSKNLGWSLSDAGMALTAQVAANIALYVFVIPSLSRLLTSPQLPFRLSPTMKDLYLARASGTLLAIGALLLAFPSAIAAVGGLMIFTLGLGFGTLCRVLVTALVDSNQTARLYTIISILNGAGELSSGPAIAWLFKVGMKMGDGMCGLPFIAVAGVCAIAAVLVFTVQGSALTKDDSANEAEEES